MLDQLCGNLMVFEGAHDCFFPPLFMRLQLISSDYTLPGITLTALLHNQHFFVNLIELIDSQSDSFVKHKASV